MRKRMKKMMTSGQVIVSILIIVGYYWNNLPPINIFSGDFWLFLIFILFIIAVNIVLSSYSQGFSMLFSSKNPGTAKPLNGKKDVTAYFNPFLGKVKWIVITIIAIAMGLGLLSFFNTRVFRAKSYANVIKVKNADFKKDFPETNISTLALLDRESAEKIGDTYLGTIDKVSQFGISDDYRQITIGKQPYRVSPLQYKSFWKWLTNRTEGINYYVKVNQTTGKAELEKLQKPMKYSDSEFMFRDTMRHLRFLHPFTIFADPSFEVDDQGNPYYVATTYKPKFGLSSPDPTGVILLDAVTGKTKHYKLGHIPEWVDRVYSAENVIQRVDDHYTYHNGYWNTVFSQAGVKNTTDSYNYITIGSDIYLYTGITSATADSSNLGFILVNMRTREITNYKLASATETSAMKSAEGEVQEKNYTATAPTLVKLNNKAFYLVSLKDEASLVKSYALVDAEDYQQVTVNNDIETLISQFTDRDTSGLTTLSPSNKKVEKVSGTIEQVASQTISGTTIYYIMTEGKVYKIRASRETSDYLPFVKAGDQFTAELGEANYLQNFKLTLEKSTTSNQTN
ncbi:membrane protein [Streptococcus parauberis KCTC 11537]|nr:membrane protein [Streptococcus parauberis KCTC 11537]